MGERAKPERDVIVLVTADHGRSDGFRDHGRDHPESARTFLIAGGGPIRARGYVASPTPRHLADVAPTIAALAASDWAPSSEGAGQPLPELLEAARQP
jgi:arylsulfatase A-like enzyme